AAPRSKAGPTPRPTARPVARRRPPRRVRLSDPQRRLRVVLVLICFVLSLFAGRLVQLQGLDASTYAEAARNERLRTVVLPATRGDIVDAAGVPLATTSEAYDLSVDQTQVTNPAAYALQLQPVLKSDLRSIQQALTGDARFAYVEKGLDPEAWRAVRQLRLPGLYAEPTSQRVYPAGAVAGNVVGFVGADGEGLAGLEMSYDGALAGQPGELTYEVGPGERRLPVVQGSRVEPTTGEGLRLTIDRDVQWFAEQALAEAVSSSGAKGGSALVMDVRTGDVLAMATSPVVDPNDPGALPDRERGNPAVEDAYEPGSVQKVLTAAAVIEEGAITADAAMEVPSSIRRGGHTIRDSVEHPTGLTFAGVLAKSSNVGTLLAAERVDSAVLRQYLVDFGLGATPGLGFAGESPGLLPAEWSDLNRDTIAFGQGVSASIVQMVSAYATIANGGVRVPPRLVDARIDPDGTEHEVAAGEPRRVVSQATADEVTLMMEGVMGEDGTGQRVAERVPGFRLAGKTGTAQRVNPSCGCYSGGGNVVSFMGFAPADAPRIAVAVTVDRPAGGGSGSGTAGPAWADTTAFTLQHLGVEPSGAEPPRVRLFTG
ncbi:MAG TPA: penicillin-binding protein 2, partial [Jiangellales bacterium]|nr:penicillin-binding protein 2 [Jiangellales bacterium]